MKGEPFLIKLVKLLCWAFVLGVGIANVIGPQEHAFMVKMWVMCGTFMFLSVYLFFSNRELVKYTLIPSILVLGIASYQWRFDTSNPDHIKNFKTKDRWSQIIIRGTIIEDPDVRDWTTHVVLKPESIVTNPLLAKQQKKPHPFYRKKKESENEVAVSTAPVKLDEKMLSGRTGHVILYVSKRIREQNKYFDNMEYGDRIEISGPLSDPMIKTNPYGFDYSKNLINRNIYASMYVGKPESIKFLGKSTVGFVGKVKKFSYELKDKMILSIKKTLPPPSSAFIGGVTVGARGGVPEVMKYDFQATGVAHVLALSGLHVGFLAFMLIMLFNNFFKSAILFYKLPSKIFRRELDLTPYTLKLIPFFVVGMLMIFVIVTGARPATVRASMMYSIGIIFNMWFGLNLRRAGSITIPLSAAIMLGFNSFLIYDSSFALSFTAVWSIIYLSGPLRNIFTRLIVGWGMVVFFIFFTSIISIAVISPWYFSNGLFASLYFLLIGVLSVVAYYLEKEYPLRGFEFEGWWRYVSGFFAVQLSIQIGMMWPLSGVWFNRFPVAGLLANFIAIPLIGIIVPLGLLGEIFTLVPGIGENLGLAIGGTNVLCSEFFLSMAKFFRTYFPYPIQSAATSSWLVSYYLAVMIFAFNRQIRKYFVINFNMSKKVALIFVIALIGFVYASNLWTPSLVKVKAKEKNELLVTFMDVGFANSVIVQLPSGKTMLVDGGARGDKRFWTSGKWGAGKTILVPNLSGYNVNKIDKMVMTNTLPENIGGLIYLLKHYNVGELWDSLNPEVFKPRLSYPEFINNLGDIRIKLQKDRPLPMGMYLNYYDILNSNLSYEMKESTDTEYSESKLFSRKQIPRYHIKENPEFYEEEYEGKTLTISVMNPPEPRIDGTENDIQNNSVVMKIIYGDRSILLTSNIWAEGEWELMDKYPRMLQSDLVSVPDHGSSMASSESFIDSVDPSFAVIQSGYMKDRSFYSAEVDRTESRYRARGIKVYRTDREGGIEVRTDGTEMKISTVLGED